MNTQTLFDKYEQIRMLGQGRDGETYLVRHKKLNVLRAAKRIHRASQIAIPQEAYLLKALKHPGIPLIYDLEQDKDYCYIIMEYIEGQTLSEFISFRKTIDLAQVLSFGIQLCDILEYLHSRRPEPILHLDLQPQNLMIANGQIKLIDFGNALGLSSSFQDGIRYGTNGFAAPELYKDEAPGVASDLYSVGKLLYYMLTNDVLYDTTGNITALCFERLSRLSQQPELGEQLGETICKCLYPTPALRYRNARTLKVSLEYLFDKVTGLSSDTHRFPTFYSGITNIALCGISPGIGTTHVSLALTAELNRRKKKAIYIEEHSSQMLYRLKETDSMVREHNGIYMRGNCFMTFQSHGVEDLDAKPFSIRVRDFGVCTPYSAGRIREEADFCLLVSGMQSWQRPSFREAMSMLPASSIALLNFGDGKLYQHLLRELGSLEPTRILRLPYLSDPFLADPAGEAFFHALFSLLNLE